MLQVKIKTKQELLKLIQSSDIKAIEALDIRVPEDINDIKKLALQMMASKKSVTMFAVAS